MAKGRESFERRQRERAKKAKADAKRERRHARRDESTDEPEPEDTGPRFDQQVVLADLEKLHAAYEDKKIDFDTFEEQRAELLARLQVD